MKKRVWICVALCALLVWAAVPSLAEDCFTIDVDALDMNSLNSDDYVAQYLSASAQGATRVHRLSVRRRSLSRSNGLPGERSPRADIKLQGRASGRHAEVAADGLI